VKVRLSKHYWLIPAALILLGGILMLVGSRERPAAPAVADAGGTYQNERYRFGFSYPSTKLVAQEAGAPAGPQSNSFSFSKNDATLSIDVYEPAGDEKSITLAEFVRRAVEDAEIVGPALLGEEEAMLAAFSHGKVKIGQTTLALEQSEVVFLKRPSYYVYAILRGGTPEDRRELGLILQTIRFQ
jgi:hypothetical protein